MDKTSQEIDLELVELAKSGDQTAYEKLYAKYKGKLNFTILKMVNSPEDAEDLMMEAFAKTFSRLEEYNSDYCFSTYLFNIAKNLTTDRHRALKRREQLNKNIISMDATTRTEQGDEVKVTLKSESLSPEEIIERDEKHAILREAVKKIRPTYRKLIELNYFEEMSYKEISDALDKPSGSVKAQLYRAKEELREVLNEDPDFIL